MRDMWWRWASVWLGVMLALTLGGCQGATTNKAAVVAGKGGGTMSGVHGFEVTDIDGRQVSLADYEGKVLLIVNVASKCGFTKQYEGLQALYDQYKERNFVVLGFPANNFAGQEPGTNAEIQQFCTQTYGVSFPMFAKISVKGKEQHPLYGFLTSKQSNPEHGGKVTWNFNKFLVDSSGKVIDRFGSRSAPQDKRVEAAIEKALMPSEAP